MEGPEVPVEVFLVHLGSADVAVSALPRPPLFGNHKGSVKFLGFAFLAAL